MERYETSRRHAALAVAAALLLAVATAVAAQPSSAPPEELWITLGADAFEHLRALPGLPLPSRLAARSGVVLTRVRVQDLGTISTELHRLTGRCAGFMAHRTLERAHQALEAADRVPVARGAGDYTINQQVLVEGLDDAIDKPSILATIDHLSTAYNNRYHAHPSGVAAAEWIRDLWQGYAEERPEVTVDLVVHPGINQRSVVLTIPGASFPAEVVVLGAHLDSIASGSGDPDFPAPGADDDASGIAVLSEVARVILAGGFVPQRTIQVMGYAAEEVGLVGSQDIAAAYQTAGTDVVAVLQLDMTDYNGSVEDIGFLADFTNPALSAFLGELVDTYQPELLWTTTACGYGCSDHASWHGRGFPASMAFESRFGQHNPTIHTTGDTLATLGDSVDHAYKFARLALAFAIEIGNPVIVGIFIDGFESGDTASWSTTTP